jgi:hypothetical protein
MTTILHDEQYPVELLSSICAFIYSACIPHDAFLDPWMACEDTAIPTAVPASYPKSVWSEHSSRRTLSTLCLVNRAWYEAAKPWLWKKLEVRLPRSWLALVDQIAWDYDEETVDQVMENTVKAAARAAAVASGQTSSQATLEEHLLDSIKFPEDPIPIDLLSPAASREPSPKRFIRHKSKSPARWELMRSISDLVQDVMEERQPGVYGTPHVSFRWEQHFD